MIGKKGELTTQQLVTITVLIVSFVILLIFLFTINFGEDTRQQICRNSVELASKKTGGIIGFGEQRLSRLDCVTNYVCASPGEKCTQSPTAEISKVNDENGFYDLLANEMATCWWMFGEGELEFINKDGIKCGICSQIYLNDELAINYAASDFDKILQEKIVDGREITHWQYYARFFMKNNIQQINSGKSIMVLYVIEDGGSPENRIQLVETEKLSDAKCDEVFSLAA
jgi:hypothetical protein